MEVLFGKKAPELERLEKQAEQMTSLHKIISDSSAEIAMIRRNLLAKNGVLESCASCINFTPPNACEIGPDVQPAGWCPEYKRRIS